MCALRSASVLQQLSGNCEVLREVNSFEICDAGLLLPRLWCCVFPLGKDGGCSFTIEVPCCNKEEEFRFLLSAVLLEEEEEDEEMEGETALFKVNPESFNMEELTVLKFILLFLVLDREEEDIGSGVLV